MLKWFKRRLRRQSPTSVGQMLFGLQPHDIDSRVQAMMALTNDRSQPNINALTIATRNLDAIALNIKANGYRLARELAAALPVREQTEASHVGLKSKLSTQADIESDWVAHWCAVLKIPIIFHRKIWELCYVLQAIHEAGSMRPGMRGLGFGCGIEPIPSILAARGVKVTMTDLPPDDVRAKGWSDTSQFAAALEKAWASHLVDWDLFQENMTLRSVDMNDVPDDLVGYDFCWSICALEHLGSIEQGSAFIERSLDTLRPGGIAVHTTEFNVNPIGSTIDNWPAVFFRRSDMEGLAARLAAKGHTVSAFDFDPGSKPMDEFIDLPPWHDGVMEHLSRGLGQPYHLKIAADGFVVTCVGIVIRKAGEVPDT